MTVAKDQPVMRQVRWIGEIDNCKPTLGLPVLPDIRTCRLYQAAPEHGGYNHHGYIIAHDDALFATWSNHATDEDAPGQRVLWSRSTDGGTNWTAWRELFPPQDAMKAADQQDWNEDRVLIANGFAVAASGLYAVAEAHVLEQRRGLGRLARQIRADGACGPIFWLVNDPPAPLPGFPAYPSATNAAFADTAATINACLARPEQSPSWEFLHQSCSPTAADGHRLCEPTQGWKLADGTYVRLYRDLGEAQSGKTFQSGRNYAAFSEDDGATWSPPIQSEFPDAGSRSAVGLLPDGTAFVINNPGATRDPLVISLAADGLGFDRHAVIAHGSPPQRLAGRWKGPGFQYPRAAVHGDKLLVIYSINKEDVEVAIVPLNILSDTALKRSHACAKSPLPSNSTINPSRPTQGDSHEKPLSNPSAGQ